MHDGSFDNVRDVVEYFNAGIPMDAQAAAASTFSSQFSNPRGPGYPAGLGLSDSQVDDLTDFIENALFDPALVEFDPNSTTNTFELNEEELTYSVFRPDLAALGAVDGFVASGQPPANNDALSRRDMGLEFLDVGPQVGIEVIDSRTFYGDKLQVDVVKFTNNSSSVVDTNLLIIAEDLAPGVKLLNASERTGNGDPFIRVFLDDGVLLPGQSTVQTLRFKWKYAAPVTYSLKLLSGQGTP